MWCAFQGILTQELNFALETALAEVAEWGLKHLQGSAAETVAFALKQQACNRMKQVHKQASRVRGGMAATLTRLQIFAAAVEAGVHYLPLLSGSALHDEVPPGTEAVVSQCFSVAAILCAPRTRGWP